MLPRLKQQYLVPRLFIMRMSSPMNARLKEETQSQPSLGVLLITLDKLRRLLDRVLDQGCQEWSLRLGLRRG